MEGQPPAQHDGPTHAPLLGVELAGSLPCVRCGYELQGLSVLGSCPECGTAVRATVLHRVDPMADAFVPLRRPRLVAWGQLVWAVGGAFAAVLLWAAYAALRVERTYGRALVGPEMLVVAAIACVCVSAAGCALVLRPFRATSAGAMLGVGVAVLAYGPIVWGVHRIGLELDPRAPAAYAAGGVRAGRVLVRLVVGAAVVVALLGVRPVRLRLMERSLALRTRRVERQPLVVTVVPVLVAALGDGLRLLSTAVPREMSWWVEAAGTVAVAFGSALVTVGLVASAVDAVRIRRAIVAPAPSPCAVLARK